MPETPTPVVVEQTFDAAVEDVWNAIVDPRRMRRWFFEQIEDFEPVVGFETQFDVPVEDRTYPHHWRVTDVVPHERITYDWHYPGHEGESKVTWNLERTPDGTKLTLVHTGIETFPDDDPVFTRQACEGGWRYFVQENLKAYLR